jgi:hypothetical protein
MQRWLYPAVFALLAGLVAGKGQAQGTGQCKLAIKGDSPVARACAEGGLMRAKQTMRGLVKKAKSAGVKFECEDCHVDDNSFERLSPDAKGKFAKLLDATRPK